MSEPIGAELNRPGDRTVVLVRSGDRVAPAPSPSAGFAGTSPCLGEDVCGSAANQPPPQTGGDVREADRGGGPRPHGGTPLGTIEVVVREVDDAEAVDAWPLAGELVAAWTRGELSLDAPVREALERIAGVAPRPSVPHVFESIAGLRYLPLRTKTLPPATHTNCFILGHGELTVVDPGSDEPGERRRLAEALRALEGQGHRLARVVLTHHHADHVAGVAPLLADGVELWAHPAAAHRLPGLRVDRALEDGDRALPGWVAHHTPGHVPDHLVLQHVCSSAVIGGDLVAAVGTIVVSPPDGNMADYFRSLARVRGLGPSVLYPSHGPPIPDPDAHLAAYLAHRQQREDEVVAALAAMSAPATALELVPHIYADVPAVVWPLAARNVLAHLEKLREEGRARCERDRWACT